MITDTGNEPETVATPLSLAIDLAPLDRSKNPVEQGITEILSLVQDIRTIVGNMAKTAGDAQGSSGVDILVKDLDQRVALGPVRPRMSRRKP